MTVQKRLSQLKTSVHGTDIIVNRTNLHPVLKSKMSKTGTTHKVIIAVKYLTRIHVYVTRTVSILINYPAIVGLVGAVRIYSKMPQQKNDHKLTVSFFVTFCLA